MIFPIQVIILKCSGINIIADVRPSIDVDFRGQWRPAPRSRWSEVDVSKSVNLSGLTYDVSHV